MGYFSCVIAGTLLGGADRHLNSAFNIFVLPIVAAFVMTQWDVVMDPPSSTISKAWIWHDGGPFFGVPTQNYAGWHLTSWLFYQAFALYLHFWADKQRQIIKHERPLRFAAILIYVCAGLTYITPWLMQRHGLITDAAGDVWRFQDIFVCV